MTTISQEESFAEFEPNIIDEPTDRELIERWVTEGALEFDSVFYAQDVRDVLEELHMRHVDEASEFRLSPDAVLRYTQLASDSYSVDTIRLTAVEPETQTAPEVVVETPIVAVSKLGARVLEYVNSKIENLDETEWDKLDTLDIDPEIAELCTQLSNRDLDPIRRARLSLVAESIGMKLARKTVAPVAFIRDGSIRSSKKG